MLSEPEPDPRSWPGACPSDGLLAAVMCDAADLCTIASVHLGQAGGALGEARPYWLGSDPREVAVADMNADGTPDIVALTATGVAVLPHE